MNILKTDLRNRKIKQADFVQDDCDDKNPLILAERPPGYDTLFEWILKRQFLRSHADSPYQTLLDNCIKHP